MQISIKYASNSCTLSLWRSTINKFLKFLLFSPFLVQLARVGMCLLKCLPFAALHPPDLSSRQVCFNFTYSHKIGFSILIMVHNSIFCVVQQKFCLVLHGSSIIDMKEENLNSKNICKF